jgi:plastocyanin
MNKLVSIVIISAISLTAIFLTGCGTAESTSPQRNAGEPAAAPPDTAPNGKAAFALDFKSEPAEIRAGTPATLAFTVKDQRGGVVKDLQIVHEKPMHLLVVSKDLAEFYHIHPEQSPDGSYRVQHVFPNGGDYRLYADFTPQSASQVVERVDVKVTGTERPKAPLIADKNLEKTVEGLRIVMRPDGTIKAGEELMLNFAAFDSATNRPATDLQNYLGELAHFAIISEDMEDFVHAHPMSKAEHSGTGGGDHAADGHKHSTMEGAPSKPSASEVAAHTAFPRTGLYKVWAQFQRNGKVITVPFVVDAAGSERKASVAPPNVPPGATLIKVTSDGYEPATVPARKGQPVKLAFYRSDTENCGGELVVTKQNIKKKLPLGETVLVEFTPDETGEIAFACGMDMMRGKIVVSGD